MDDYYDKIFFGGSADGSSLLSEDFENLDQRDLRVSDERNKWFIKQDNDGNAIYCNKATNDWTEFMFGSSGWSDYSISYKIKLSTKKTGTLETHIRIHSGDYRRCAYHNIQILRFIDDFKDHQEELEKQRKRLEKWCGIDLFLIELLTELIQYFKNINCSNLTTHHFFFVDCLR